MSYIPELVEPIPIDTIGGKPTVSAHDEEVLQINQDMKSELKKIHFQLAHINDIFMEDGDVNA